MRALKREHRANDQDGSRNVERARNHLVHVGASDCAQNAVHRGEQLGERERERRLRRRRRLRQIRARELIAPFFAAPLEQVDDLAHLLILEQPSHELGARILPLLLVIRAAAASAP